jgi:hypothetical protein
MKNKLYKEIVIKNLVLVLIVFPINLSLVRSNMLTMDFENQNAILSVLGLLMAAAILGAFEVTYSKINIGSTVQRNLTHLVKFFLYTSISLMMVIAITTLGLTEHIIDDPLVWAMLPIMISLYIFDIWDAVSSASKFHNKTE